MKHLATIQSEFLKIARNWDDLSYEEQKGYLERHPQSKRKITAKPQSNELSESSDLTTVQQKVLNACDPLITNLQDSAVNYYERQLKRFNTEFEKAPKENDFNSLVKIFSNNNVDTMTFLKSVYNKKNPNNYIYNSKNDDVYLDQQLKERFYDKLKLNIREYNVQKLNDALTRYITPEFVRVENINVSQGTKGFEITANLVDDQNRTWNFETKAVGAGGYNIQEWHYRYLINLSSPEVPREVVRQKISEREKQQKEERQQQLKTDRLEKQRDKAVKKLVSVFGEIKSRIKDWDSWERHNLNVQVSEHKRSQQEFDQTLSDVNRLREFLQKYNFKRTELTKKIKDNEINFDSLNEINDIINKNLHYFYSYKEAKWFHDQNLI